MSIRLKIIAAGNGGIVGLTQSIQGGLAVATSTVEEIGARQGELLVLKTSSRSPGTF
jgi:hypothetical protein